MFPRGSCELLVQLGDLSNEHSKGERHPRGKYFERSHDLAELAARHGVNQLHHHARRVFDGGKKSCHGRNLLFFGEWLRESPDPG